MKWTQQDGMMVAETDHGQYAIYRKDPEGPDRTFRVRLNSGDDEHSMEGEHDSIISAREAAETDLAYRDSVWEKL